MIGTQPLVPAGMSGFGVGVHVAPGRIGGGAVRVEVGAADAGGDGDGAGGGEGVATGLGLGVGGAGLGVAGIARGVTAAVTIGIAEAIATITTGDCDGTGSKGFGGSVAEVADATGDGGAAAATIGAVTASGAAGLGDAVHAASIRTTKSAEM